VAGCFVLVGLSYVILRVFVSVAAVPRTPVRELSATWQLVLPLEEEVLDLQIDGSGSYLACITAGGERNRLLVTDLDGGKPLWEAGITGRSMAWMAGGKRLVYEDAGDIILLDLEEMRTVNLTGDGEMDREPRPSPRGDLILWTRVEALTGEPQLWLMRGDGSDKRFLAPWQELVTWDPQGEELVSLGHEETPGAEGEVTYFLQKTSPGEEGWTRYYSCEGPVYHVWWPSRDDLLMVGPWKSGDEVRGVVFKVRPGEKAARLASTSGLSDDPRRYRFCEERGGTRLAYVGEKGLEILDYAGKVVYRYPFLDAGNPLAWDVKDGELYFTGRDGIYRFKAP